MVAEPDCRVTDVSLDGDRAARACEVDDAIGVGGVTLFLTKTGSRASEREGDDFGE